MTVFLNILTFTILFNTQIFVPVLSADRQDISTIRLTKIGQFGLIRKARAKIPEHFHTGIDIQRPNNNYDSEPVFPIAIGRVISKRTDGPYANLIIEHEIDGHKCWTLYEHIAGIKVGLKDIVNPGVPIARFMNKNELDRYGWQFDHFHLEILKIKPMAIKPDKTNPERLFNAYSLLCYTTNDLYKYYFNPVEFFKKSL
jgi:hypothetical protein